MDPDPFADCLILTGPTGSGKSRLALDLAGRLDAEIVCADSMTLYRGMDIGTAKPDAADPDRPSRILAVTGKAGSGKSMLLARLTHAMREAGVRIVSPEWQAWMRLARKPSREFRGAEDNRSTPSGGGGCKSVKRTDTGVLILSESGKTEPSKCCRGAAGDLDRSGHMRIRAGRGTGHAMR